MNAFVDTNVLMDVLLKRQPFHEASVAVWSRVAARQVAASISAISVNNAHYITRKAAGAEAALQAVKAIRETFQIVPLDLAVIDAAIASGMTDFEDAIQYASALHSGVACIVTRNTRDFPAERLAVLTPEQFLAIHGVQEPAP